MTGRLHRIQYACNLPATLLPATASNYLAPIAPTLLVLGHMLYPDFFAWAGKHWKDVIYAPFGVQGPGTEAILHHAAILQPPVRLAYYLPQENVAFVLASNRHRNHETTQYWTYRGASIVLVSKEMLSNDALRSLAPAAHVYADDAAAVNRAANNTLSVSNPALHKGMCVANYDKQAFFDVRVKNEQACEVNPDVAKAGAALYPAERNAMYGVNPYDPLK
jgi:hypothetical protein